MKNSFKIGFLALAIAVSAAACKGKSGAAGGDTTAKDTTAKMAAPATDTSKMKDTSKMAKDTSKMKDTTKKK